MNFLLFIYLFGVWIGVYDFIVSPEMKGRGAGCNCYPEPNLTDSCVPKSVPIRQSSSVDLTNCVCLKLNGMQVCALSLGKASTLSLDLVLKIIQGDRL